MRTNPNKPVLIHFPPLFNPLKYLAIDTQMICGGRRYEISPEDYIAGALMLYMDIIQIFLYILQITGHLGGRD